MKRNQLLAVTAIAILLVAVPSVATLPLKTHILSSGRSASKLTEQLFFVRGGGAYEDYSSDDEYSDDSEENEADEASAVHDERREQHSQAPQLVDGRPLPPRVDGRGRTKAPYIPKQKKKKQKKKKSALSQLASTSLSLSKKAAVTTVKTSGKAAVYLMKPKSISEPEIWGIWRLDQQVGVQQSTANIELTRRGIVVIRDGDHVIWKAPFRFKQPTWPQSCRIEFEARAFQPGDTKRKPWLLYYKGYLERKMADPKVIKMVGKLYSIERPKSMFGKDLPVRYKKIGSFVGRKRVVIVEDEQEGDEYDDDQYDNEEEEEDQRYRDERSAGRRRGPPQDEEELEEYDEYEYEYEEEL